MKKRTMLILSVLLLACAICASLTMRDKYEIDTYKIDTATIVYELSDAQLENNVGISPNLLKEHHVLFSIIQTSCEKIFILHAKEGKITYVKGIIDKYIDSLSYQEEENEYMKNKKSFIHDDIYVLVISKNAQTIIDELKERLIE